MTKYFVNGQFELKNLTTWKRYPVKISKEVVQKVIKKSRKKYNPKHVKYLLSLLFSEMAQDFGSTKTEDNIWFFDNFGSFKLRIYDKVVRVTDKPFIKENCKTIRFAFAYNFKATAYKVLNKNDKKVIDYLIEKRRNRTQLRKITSVKYDKNG